MRGMLKFFALLSFIGDCVSALGTVYPQWENAYNTFKLRKEALKTEEEKAAEAAAKAEAEAKANGTWQVHVNHNSNVQDTTYEEVKTGTNGGGQI